MSKVTAMRSKAETTETEFDPGRIVREKTGEMRRDIGTKKTEAAARKSPILGAVPDIAVLKKAVDDAKKRKPQRCAEGRQGQNRGMEKGGRSRQTGRAGCSKQGQRQIDHALTRGLDLRHRETGSGGEYRYLAGNDRVNFEGADLSRANF